MTSLRRALGEMAEQIAVPERPPVDELTRRFHRRRRRRVSLAVAGMVVIVLVGVLQYSDQDDDNHSRHC